MRQKNNVRPIERASIIANQNSAGTKIPGSNMFNIIVNPNWYDCAMDVPRYNSTMMIYHEVIGKY